MKIKIIYPAPLDEQGRPRKFHKVMMLGLTMPYLAALIGPGHEIKIVNETVQALDIDEPVDLVAITSITSHVPRAYQIADAYRDRGVPVVMGGCHVTLMAEEALEHADAVVRGESEGLWEEIIDDAERNQLKPIYQREAYSDLKGLPSPRYDLVDMKHYWFPIQAVQAVRGCPRNCDFCSVAKLYGGSYRYRPAGEVIEDARRAGGFIVFIDDNFFSSHDYCLEIFEGLRPMQKYWFAQASFDQAADDEFLRQASRAGCKAIFVGIESINPVMRNNLGKRAGKFGKKEISELIRIMRRYNIELLASMMVSLEDDAESIEETIEFLIENGVTALYLYLLTPLPQTSLYLQQEEDQGILSRDWSKYDGTHCLCKPLHVSSQQLENDYWMAQERFYSVPSILRRFLRPPRITFSHQNLIYRTLVNKRIHPMMGLDRKDLHSYVIFLPVALMDFSWTRKLYQLLRL